MDNFNDGTYMDEMDEIAQINSLPDVDLGPGFISGPQIAIDNPAEINPKLAISSETPAEPNLNIGEINPYSKSEVSLKQVEQPNPSIPGMEGLPDAYAKSFKQAEDSINLGAKAQSEGFQKQAMIQEKLAEDLRQAEIKTQERLAPLEERSRVLYDSILNDKVDPNRLWNESGTGNKIVASIGILLSGIGSGIAGGNQKNLALEVIENSINRDIEAQRMNLGRKQSLYSENLRALGDEKQALLATKAQLLSVAQAQIQSISLKTNSKEAQAKGISALSQLELQKAQIKQQIQKDQLVQNMSANGSNVNDAQVQQMPKDIRERAIKIGGKYVLALDEMSAKKSRELIGANEALVSNLDELMALRQKYGSETVPGPVKAKMQTIASNLELSLKEAKALGTLDAGAERYMKKLVADPTGYTFAMDQYKALKEVQNRETKARLKAFGVNVPENAYSNEVERIAPNGRVAIFDSETKKFIRYK